MTWSVVLFSAVMAFGISGWLLWGNRLATRIAASRRRRRLPPPKRPRIRISIPHGEAIFTRVWLDDHELAYVTRVRFDAAASAMDGMAIVTLDLHAEVEMEGDCGLVISGTDPRTGATYEVQR